MKNNIRTKIWRYLILFSILILVFLWIFQIVLLPSYYESSKTKELESVVLSISRSYQKSQTQKEFFLDVSNIAHKSGICIIVSDAFSNTDYATNSLSKECLSEDVFNQYKQKFIRSDKQKDHFLTINPLFKNKTLVNSLKLDDNFYIFASSSLVPIDSTISILRKQFILVTILVLLLALVISYFISKKLSNPIIKLTNATKKFGKQEEHQAFDIPDEFFEITELAKTLEYANNEVVQTDELRKELMANVSHDLKTPLTMIKAYAEMVRDLTYRDKKKREQNLNVIIEEADRLNQLVNDILTLSVMENKMMVLEIQEIDLNDFIESILGRYQIFEFEEEYHFRYEGCNHVKVKADPQKLEQVFYNLINNAIQYTGDDKEICIQVTNQKKDYLVEIKNHGEPIPKEELKNIWNKYYRSKKNHQRSIVGTGLGLSIVKQILELHNFKYGVISNQKEGTIFYFRIPK